MQKCGKSSWSGQWNIDAKRTRISTAIGYLMPARGRPNLAIRPNCLVDRVVFDGRRAVSVEVFQNGVRQIVSGRRITLCGGAIGSPSILLRSGVGPADEIKAIGIEPKLSLSGVGRNLVDHAMMRLSWNAVPGPVDEFAQCFQVLMRYTAPGSHAANDMQIVPSRVYGPTAAKALGGADEAAVSWDAAVTFGGCVSATRYPSQSRLRPGGCPALARGRTGC